MTFDQLVDIIYYIHLLWISRCQYKLEIQTWGCRQSSVDSSVPTRLTPRVWVPSMPSMLLSFSANFQLYLSCEKNKINKKRPGLALFSKSKPDAVFGIIFAVDVAAKSFPRKPAHRWRQHQSIVERKNTGNLQNKKHNSGWQKFYHFMTDLNTQSQNDLVSIEATVKVILSQKV